MPPYLVEHPPTLKQYRIGRRKRETGCIVVHTPQAGVDVLAPDTKAEDVAAYIARRTDRSASYHAIPDSDSWVHLVPWEWEAMQDATGSNAWAVGISFACNAADWPHLPPAWIEGALTQGALAACAYALDLHRRTGIVIPARRITKAQSDRGEPGFISHGERDPARRSDPGPGFPWARYLDVYAYFAALNGLPVLPPLEDPMADPEPFATTYTDWDRARDQFTAAHVDEILRFFRPGGNMPIPENHHTGTEAILGTNARGITLVALVKAGLVDPEEIATAVATAVREQDDVEVDVEVVMEGIRRVLREGVGDS